MDRGSLDMIAKRKIDEYYMSHALSLAWRGLDTTSPNPRVGCVLVKEGRVIGEGYHARWGGPHAEVVALNDAAKKGGETKGATAYVTLEPCSHFGKTPPCAPRLVDEGIARVVVGSVDPNPKVKGKGLEILKAAGVEVSFPCLEKECKWLNRGFFRSKTLNRPWVTLKAATGLDGKMALASGESKWITGDTARNWAHLLRAEHDGILVGVGTVRVDDPELTARNTCGKSPLRIILDVDLSLPLNSRVLQGGCLIFADGDGSGFSRKKRTLEQAGAEVCVVPSVGGRVDLKSVLQELTTRQVQSLMVEGGPKVISAFIEAEFCDSLVLFASASLLGEGRGLGEGLRFDSMGNTVRLRETTVRRAGEDLLVEGIFRCSPAL
ncbi:MAG: bifunctional diaminohydroxyphosphoribosylaminopyrimidine deaminase/5-amino-6-(5-phosphoribosylamino)uracil reductase RibD [Synergistaceae bacterium]|nr:bifunctional diaminohydroxyphosphoribosylaminopyrimidine deaminase/5-amino-6-(5-phosphoribosylamino)uracil reductase RibD [Synergistaceae bacterium]